MTDWRNYILKHFQESVHRLTLVADPDGLLLEENLLFAIRRNGFDLLPFDDPIAFRYAYESDYRQHWDEGQDTDLVVILRSSEADLRALPYDLLQSGRLLAFGLPELFPKLSYPIVKDLDLAHLPSLYAAYQQYYGAEMGDQASALFVLRHAFGIVPELVKTPADLLKLLLSRHVRGERVPPRLDGVLLAALRRNAAFERWPLESLLESESDFLAFLQEAWIGYLAARQPPDVAVRDVGPTYETGVNLPFDDPDVRAYVGTLFLERELRPVRLPQGWQVEGWAQVGVIIDETAFERRRFCGLLDLLRQTLPSADGTYKDWMETAKRWAELLVLRYRLATDLEVEKSEQYRALHREIESRFADWMIARYHTLHSLPFLPHPVMVHHVSGYLAARASQRPRSRVALLVVDGLALDQWLVIRDAWIAEGIPWSWDERTVFAWAPTLTPISRQATFAGTLPKFFPDSWQTTVREQKHWRRFWREQGLKSDNVGYARNLGVKDLDLNRDVASSEASTLETDVLEMLDNPQVRVAGLVVNTIDNVMHGMQLGTAGMHQQVKLWMTRYRYLTKLVQCLLKASFDVYLTSDHGNVWAHGIGRPKEGVLVETRGERARIYTDPAFLALAQQQLPETVEWTNVGLPEGISVLLAMQLDAFLNVGDHAICHGGIALEEVIVPFVRISRDATV